MTSGYPALTEARHPESLQLDRLPVPALLDLMQREDARVVEVVGQALPAVARLVDELIARLGAGGRLFYVGAGTSGRLGALDAAECPPTFGTDPEQVQAVLAGGLAAFGRAVEHAEDDEEAGARELEARGLGPPDFVFAISASGRTPFALGALALARRLGAGTGALFCNPGAPLGQASDHPILLPVGAEILTGSTRLKAGTATKMVLNMISTATMVGLGRCMGNLMVDVRAGSAKLRERKVRILCEAAAEVAPIDEVEAGRLLELEQGDLRRALARLSGPHVSGIEGPPAP